MGRFLESGNFSFPPPFTGILGYERRGSPAFATKLHEKHAVVSNFVTCIHRFSAFFAKTKFHSSSETRLYSRRQCSENPLNQPLSSERYVTNAFIEPHSLSHVFLLSRQKDSRNNKNFGRIHLVTGPRPPTTMNRFFWSAISVVRGGSSCRMNVHRNASINLQRQVEM